MRQTAVDAQQIEHWKAMNEAICAAFHVPAYLAGAAPPPAYNNIEALKQAYYSQCLQELIEAIELLLDEGLALPGPVRHRIRSRCPVTDGYGHDGHDAGRQCRRGDRCAERSTPAVE